MSNWTNVSDLGATGDGVSDDSAAFNAAFAASKSIFVPPGVYILTNLAPITHGFTLFGAGQNATELRFGSVQTGIGVELGGPLAGLEAVHIRDMSITTTNSLGGTAISIKWPQTFDNRYTSKGTIENVCIRGATPETTGWSTGVYYWQAAEVFIRSCVFMGKDLHGNADNLQANQTLSQRAVYFDCDGFYVAVSLYVSGFECYFWDTGIFAPNAPQGISVIGANFISCRVGVHILGTEEPLGYSEFFVFADSAASCYANCILLERCNQSFIHDSLLFAGGTESGICSIIELHQCADIFIHHNNLIAQGDVHPANGIVLDGNCAFVNIDSNKFAKGKQPFSTGIWLQAGSFNNSYKSNTFSGPFTIATIYDQGRRNFSGSQGCLVSLSASTQSIQSNVSTDIVWDTKDYETQTIPEFDATVPQFWQSGARVTIPGGSGIRRVRLSACVLFSENSDGFRAASINKNGSSVYPGCAQTSIMAGGDAVIVLNLSSAIIPVNENDVFTLNVTQTSGANLNVLSTSRTWLSIEAVD